VEARDYGATAYGSTGKEMVFWKNRYVDRGEDGMRIWWSGGGII